MSIGLPKGMNRNDAYVQGMHDGEQALLKELGYRPVIGIPAAHKYDDVYGNLYALCPRCNEPVRLTSGTVLEYRNHYNGNHAEADGRVLVDGVWYEKD